MSLYLKWTAKGRVPSYRGGAPLPEPGVWTDTITTLELCRSGWHACRWEDAAVHIAAELWVCELDGRVVEGPDKVVAERLRLVRRVEITDAQWRHFAADCAEAVLPLFEDLLPGDDRPRLAIQAARDFADGKITKAALSAAEAATYAATYAAADAADAAYAAYAAYAAADAADAAYAARAARAPTGPMVATLAAAYAARAAYAAATYAVADADQSDLLLNRLGLNPADFTHRSTP